MVTVPTDSPPAGLKLESLTHIDIGELSQSELLNLSLCSESAFDLRRTNDVVVPNIDRSVFNESAGGRRQTYSRLRLRPTATPGHHRLRLPGLLPSQNPKPPRSSDAETKTIVHFLKQQLAHQNRNPNSLPVQPVVSGQNEAAGGIIRLDTDNQVGANVQERAIVIHSNEREGKRKRGRKRKAKPLEHGVEIELQIANGNGMEADVTALANADDMYSEELRKRTAGLETEEGALGFLGGLEGQWCSRRKKRKYVDASEFGDSLPMGWKLLLGLRRREGRVSVYCRRYISPSGQQFVSYKEATSFLQTYGAKQPMDQRAGNTEQAPKAASSNPHVSVSDEHKKNTCVMGIDNLAEVQVRDLFECYKCNLSFDEKDEYVQHLLSVHERTTKRFRFDAPAGEGAIIKDGKYECQFCHKVFEERHSYDGHVAIHVRDYDRGSDELLPAPVNVEKSTESPLEKEPSPRISRMDALVQIAQDSILEASSAEPLHKTSGDSSPDEQKVENSSPDEQKLENTSAVDAGHDLSLVSAPNEIDMEDGLPGDTFHEDVNQHDKEYTVDNRELKFTDVLDVENNNMKASCSISEQPDVDDVEKYGNSEIEIGFGNNYVCPSNIVEANAMGLNENVIQNKDTDCSLSLVQSINCFPDFLAVEDKGGNEFCEVGHNLGNVTGFEELRFDEIEPLKYEADMSMDLVNNEMMGERFNSSGRFESGAVLSIGGRHQVTTTCIWCRTEFRNEAVDLESQSDSIGFMCPTCKVQISGHLNNSLSINFHGF